MENQLFWGEESEIFGVLIDNWIDKKNKRTENYKIVFYISRH